MTTAVGRSAKAAEEPTTLTSPILDAAFALVSASRPRPGVLLDAPCGSGYLSRKASEAGWRVVAFDIDPSQFQGGDRADVRRADLNEVLPLADASVDAVLCCEGIEHVENPWRLVREFRRVLSPGGDVVFSLPNTIDVRQRWRHFRRGALSHYAPAHESHVNPMGPLVLCHALLVNGFDVAAIRPARRPYGGPLLRPFAILFRVSRRVGLPEPVRRMASASSVLCSRTVLVHAKKRA